MCEGERDFTETERDTTAVPTFVNLNSPYMDITGPQQEWVA